MGLSLASFSETTDSLMTREQFRQDFINVKLGPPDISKSCRGRSIKPYVAISGVVVGGIMIAGYSGGSDVSKEAQKPYLISFLVLDAILVVYLLATEY